MSDVVGSASVTLESDASQLAASIASELEGSVTPALEAVLGVLNEIEAQFAQIDSLASSLGSVEVPDLQASSNLSEVAAEAEQAATAVSDLEDIDPVVDVEVDGASAATSELNEVAQAAQDADEIDPQIDVEASGAEAAASNITAVDTAAQEATTSVVGFGFSLKQVATVAAGVGVFKFFEGGIEALGNIERLSLQTEARLQATGNAANVTVGEVEALSQSLEEFTSIEAETVQEGANLILTFKAVRNQVGEGNDIFDRAVTISADLATALGTSIPGAALQLGKALEDPIRGVTALRRAGVQLTEDQQATIKAFVDSGNIIEAQKIVLGELETQVEGAARAYGQSLPGEIDQAKNKFGEFQEGLSEAFLPAIREVLEIGQEELFPALIDSAEEAAPALADLAEVGVGVLVPALQAATPLIGLAADLLGAIPTPVLAALAAFLTLRRVTPILQGVADSLRAVQTGAQLSAALGGATAQTSALATGAGGAATAVGGLATALPLIGVAAVGVITTFQEADAERKRFQDGVDSLAASIRETDDPFESLRGQISTLLTENGDFAVQLDDLGVGIDDLITGLTGFPEDFDALVASVTDGLSGLEAEAQVKALENMRDQFAEAKIVAGALNGVLGETTDESQDAAEEQANLAASAEQVARSVDDELAALTSVVSSLNEVADVTIEWADAQDLAQEREDQVRAGIESQITALESQKQALTAQGQAVAEYNKAQQAQVDALKALEAEAQQAFATIIDEADSFRSILSDAQGLADDRAAELAEAAGQIGDGFDGIAADADASLSDFREVIEANLAETAAFISDIQSLIARGADDLASFLLQQGEGAAAAADEASGLTDAQLAEQERFIEKSEARNDAQVSLVESLVDRLDGIEPPEPILITFDTDAAVANLDAQIQSLRDSAANLDFEATFADFEQASLDRLNESERFFDALNTLNDRGADDLEAYFAEQGIVSLAAAEEAATLDKDELKRREGFVESFGEIQKGLLAESKMIAGELLIAGADAGSDFLAGLLGALEDGNEEVEQAILDLFGGVDPRLAKGTSLPGFEGGGVITEEGVFRGGEGNKPEVVIPLTNPPRARELSRLTGLDRIIDDGETGGVARVTNINVGGIVVQMPPGASRADGDAFGVGIGEGLLRKIETEIGVG